MTDFIDDTDELTRDYTSGKMTVRAIAAKHGTTVHAVQEFAINNGLSHGALTELVKQGVQLRLAYSSNGPDTSTSKDVGELLPALKGVHKSMLDSASAVNLMLLESVALQISSVMDPIRYHPEDMRVKAAHALRGEKESITDMLCKLTDNMIKLRETGLRHAGALEEKSSGGGITVNNNNLALAGQNKTAIDENSKLAAVVGMVEMLRARKESNNVIDITEY